LITNQLTTYFDPEQLPFPYCPGCGHSLILDKLNEALVELQLDPNKVVIVTDIGCVGLSDKYFITNAFHGLHGRSITYATGIKLANPELEVIVLMGDGACGIGGHHLINAARRNIGITVLVFNNLNYGMTGGEHSVTTPPGGKTSSTTSGNIEQPMDICGTAAINGATFVARATSFDKQLTDLLVSAIQNEGFSLLDIWELCTAYYVPNNRFSKTLLQETMSSMGFMAGIIADINRPELSRVLRDQWVPDIEDQPLPAKPINKKYSHNVEHTERIVIAGAAGAKIASAASALCRGAILSGLHATQRNDYMVTVKSGYSMSEVILSTKPVNCKTIKVAHRLVIPFSEGITKLQPMLEKMDDSQILYINSSLLPIQTSAKIFTIDFHKTGKKKEYWTVIALAEMLRQSRIYPLTAFLEALTFRTDYARKNIEAVEMSVNLLKPG
jgi:pyruvate/2-oxoacid:ferredoxin oxidoreductase beta subunit/Pyruvate/2-oxoacid:ferredoxin oxidoreductase gamma subunit